MERANSLLPFLQKNTKMPKFPKNTGFKMKGYSYPGESPNKQVGGRFSHLTLRSDSSSPKNGKPQEDKTDPNIDKYKSGWDMDWGKALKTLLQSGGLSKKGIMKALGQGLTVPSGKRKAKGKNGKRSKERLLKGKLSVGDIQKSMEQKATGATTKDWKAKSEGGYSMNDLARMRDEARTSGDTKLQKRIQAIINKAYGL